MSAPFRDITDLSVPRHVTQRPSRQRQRVMSHDGGEPAKCSGRCCVRVTPSLSHAPVLHPFRTAHVPFCVCTELTLLLAVHGRDCDLCPFRLSLCVCVRGQPPRPHRRPDAQIVIRRSSRPHHPHPIVDSVSARATSLVSFAVRLVAQATVAPLPRPQPSSSSTEPSRPIVAPAFSSSLAIRPIIPTNARLCFHPPCPCLPPCVPVQSPPRRDRCSTCRCRRDAATGTAPPAPPLPPLPLRPRRRRPHRRRRRRHLRPSMDCPLTAAPGAAAAPSSSSVTRPFHS